MRIFALYEGQVAVHVGRVFAAERRPERKAVAHRLVLADDRHLFDVGIHLAQHVADLARLVGLVVDEARSVARQDRLAHDEEVFAEARLVAQRPADDTGVVFESFDHVHRTVDALVDPLFAACRQERRQPVALEICLRHDQDADAVAHLIECVAIGVVRVADRGDVVGFAQQQIFLDQLVRHRVPVVGVELVAVDAVDLDRSAVEQDERTSAVLHALDAHFAEAEVVFASVDLFAVRKQNYAHAVEVGIFVRPQLDVFERGGQFDVLVADRELADGFGQLGDGIVAVRQGQFDLVRRALILAGCEGDGGLEVGVFVVVFERRQREAVDDLGVRFRDQPNAAEDARKAPHVLIFEIAAGAIAIDGDRQLVGAFADDGGDVVFLRAERVLGVADELAVDIDVAAAIYAVEAQEDVAVGAVELELGDIAAGARLALLDLWHREQVELRERVGVHVVGVDGGVKALDLPFGRDVDLVKAGRGDAVSLISLGDAVDGRHEFELPLAVKTDGGGLAVLVQREARRAAFERIDVVDGKGGEVFHNSLLV